MMRPDGKLTFGGLGRASGVLTHITSLPNDEGVGSLGQEAFDFIDQLALAGQRVWQILPLNPTQNDGSPYAALSSFAGAEHVISLQRLTEQGLLAAEELGPLRALDARKIDFAIALPLRRHLVALAASRFSARADARALAQLTAFQAKAGPDWLDDYALFRALLEAHAWADWSDWPAPLRARAPEALARARAAHSERISNIRIEQFFFDQQWRALRAHAQASGIALFGDMPIYVAQTSADVWCAPHLFHLDAHGKAISVAGCPPDMMAASGQRWGNPTYDWAAMQADGFAWWIARMRHMLDAYDLVRIDHFRAFASYWQIPAKDEDASGGVWVPAPGEAVFNALLQAFGNLPVVAEDLGFITPDVYALRDAFDFPGMQIIQYDLEAEPLSPEQQPQAYPARSVAYFGNHDNATALGWLEAQAQGLKPEDMAKRPLLQAALQADEPHWALNALALHSGSALAILQMQDVLGLGAQHRMNIPGTASGNWHWRYARQDVRPADWARLREMTKASGRAADLASVLDEELARAPLALRDLLEEVDCEFLARQHPQTGLLPAGPAHNGHGDYSHAWVRDNCYCVMAIWAAAAAARQAGLPARAAHYENRAIAVLRGLLKAMQGQAEKVARFCESGSARDALHAKYDATSGLPISGDADWGHLQLDATSLFLLICTDMTGAGLRIIRTQNEAQFLSSLADYVALAWRCGDYGMWERGDKRNIGRVERNMTSLGLAKAALHALPQTSFPLDDGDVPARIAPRPPELLAMFDCALCGVLPEESFSKETDSGLLAVIGYPGYACHAWPERAHATKEAIATRLAGHYGAVRFLLDGHQSAYEHPHRLHYEPGELARFAGVECQWPLFIAFEAMDCAMAGDQAATQAALARLEAVAEPGAKWKRIPELFMLTPQTVEAERAQPGSQPRRSNDNVPLYWAQSLYLGARLLHGGWIHPDHLDPLGRRHAPPKAVPMAPSAKEALKQVLARGLLLRDGTGKWRDVLSPNAVEGIGFEEIPSPLLHDLASRAADWRVRFAGGVIALDLPALAALGDGALGRLETGPDPEAALHTQTGLDWAQWRTERGALCPIGGGFAAKLWGALDRCAGLRFGHGQRLDAALCRADHTRNERAFAHRLLLAITAGPWDHSACLTRALMLEAISAFVAGPYRMAGDLDLVQGIAAAGGAEALGPLSPARVRARIEAVLRGLE